jgi:hypothetical protein
MCGAQVNRLIPSFNENLKVFNVTLNSFTDTERNVTRKYRETCYKKHTVHQYGGNIGIATCTTAKVTKNLLTFLTISKKHIVNCNTNCFLEISANYYIRTNITIGKLWCLPL